MEVTRLLLSAVRRGGVRLHVSQPRETSSLREPPSGSVEQSLFCYELLGLSLCLVDLKIFSRTCYSL